MNFEDLRLCLNPANDGTYDLDVESKPMIRPGSYFITLLMEDGTEIQTKDFGDFKALFTQLSGGQEYVVEVRREVNGEIKESIRIPVVTPP